MILKGVTIGEHAVVAAGAVVVSSVPPRSVVLGNPARVIWRLKSESAQAAVAVVRENAPVSAPVTTPLSAASIGVRSAETEVSRS